MPLAPCLSAAAYTRALRATLFGLKQTRGDIDRERKDGCVEEKGEHTVQQPDAPHRSRRKIHVRRLT